MKFDKITREILESVANQSTAGEVPAIKNARKYTVHIGDKIWPVKFIIQKAYKEAYGQEIGHDRFSSVEARTHLKRLDFEIEEVKNGVVDKAINSMIKDYVGKVERDKNGDEIYKWQLVKKNLGKPDLSAIDFNKEIRSIEFKNLVYGVGIGAIRHLAKDKSEEYRNLFPILFNENEDLTIRLKEFSSKINTLYRQLVSDVKLSHHHDERTMATLLTFHDPTKYALFMDTFYQKFCKLLGEDPREKNEKYAHYLELLKDFIDEYVLPNSLLLKAKENFITDDSYEDSNHFILAQDILWQQLQGSNEILEIGKSSVFKISMGDFEREEFDVFLERNIVLVHSKTKAKAISSKTQADYFRDEIQIGDFFYLTHGNNINGITLIARVISDVGPCELSDYARDGWLQRKYEPIVYSVNQRKYSAKQFWWTPNDVSTCIKIKPTELNIANELLFNPYFKTTIVSGNSNDLNQLETETHRSNTMKANLNTILFGPPGTGKTFNTINHSVAIIENKPVEEILEECKRNRGDVKARYDAYVNSGLIVFTTFHQSMSYEEFIEGIKPLAPEKDQALKYDIEDGIFKNICTAAEDNWFNFQNKVPSNFSFEDILDILKEEWTKNKSMKFSMKTEGKEFTITGFTKKSINFRKASGGEGHSLSINTLKDIFYGKREAWGKGVGIYYPGIIEKLQSFLPEVKAEKTELKNYVLIIDEINRGNVSQIFGELITLIEDDKRIGAKEALKITLPYSKDDFGVPPNLFIIGTMNTADRSVEFLDTALRRRFAFEEKLPDPTLLTAVISQVPLRDILTTINERIELLLDRDHTIGHSYFLDVSDESGLKLAFKNKLLPLLQEYFFGDYGKIGLVLGPGFVKENKPRNTSLAKFPYPGHEQYITSKYELIPINDQFDIGSALKALMNN